MFFTSEGRLENLRSQPSPILAASLDLLAGQTGLLSIAHAAFFGIGAYASALVATGHGSRVTGHLGFVVGVLAGMSVAAIVSFVVSLPSRNYSGHSRESGNPVRAIHRYTGAG